VSIRAIGQQFRDATCVLGGDVDLVSFDAAITEADSDRQRRMHLLPPIIAASARKQQHDEKGKYCRPGSPNELSRGYGHRQMRVLRRHNRWCLGCIGSACSLDGDVLLFHIFA